MAYGALQTWRRQLSALLLALVGALLTEAGLANAPSTAGAWATGAAVGAAMATVLTLCGVLWDAAPRTAGGCPPERIRTTLRDRERRTAFLPQRDPDAAGRPRPRAPGRPLPTAA